MISAESQISEGLNQYALFVNIHLKVIFVIGIVNRSQLCLILVYVWLVTKGSVGSLYFGFIAFVSFCQEEFLAICCRIETITEWKLNLFVCAHSDCVNELKLPVLCCSWDWYYSLHVSGQERTGLSSTCFMLINCSNVLWSLPGKKDSCGPTAEVLLGSWLSAQAIPIAIPSFRRQGVQGPLKLLLCQGLQHSETPTCFPAQGNVLTCIDARRNEEA